MKTAKPQIFIFIGPPYAGKGTQARLLSERLSLPVFSMGELIRKARADRPDIKKAYERYAMQGKHLPNKNKFPLLQEQMDCNLERGFILDNFPATEEDLEVLTEYMKEKNLHIEKVFYLVVSKEEIFRRMQEAAGGRERLDDRPDVVELRLLQQDKDRQPVLEYFKRRGLLAEINGQQSIDEVNSEIMEHIPFKNSKKERR